MKVFTRILLVGLFLSATTMALMATHNRAGEITYEQIGPLTIRMTLTTYTKTSSTAADRDSVEIFWGDGTSEVVYRSNGNGQPLDNDVKVNYYIEEHTYPGRATYTIGFKDPNRVGSILNVNFPNSIEVEFFISTTLTLLDPQFQGVNNSAILLQPPLDFACVNQIFIHNPNAFDPDGDSLSYELVVPRMSADEEVPGYQFPDEINPGPDNLISLNPVTGDFVWRNPKQQGEYNIAIQINEWRNGVLINSIIRDMQILVRLCENEPPAIDIDAELCVIAGTFIDVPILVDDPDEGQQVKLEASGGKLLSGEAILIGGGDYKDPSFEGRFQWQTTCNDISEAYYQFVFKATDDIFFGETGLATLKTLRIKVIGPPPENLMSESEDGAIRLTWDSPYDCEATDNEYFQGFSVWRKVGSTALQDGPCDYGLTGTPYEKVVVLTTEQLDGRYTALDPNIEKGVTYCYRVQAEFAQLTSAGFPFNDVESKFSNEVCQQLDRDLPLLTKVSIDETASNGVVHIRWSKPLPEDLDTVLNPPPYTYELFRSLDGGITFNEVSGFEVTTSTFAEHIPLDYFDTPVQTIVNQPYYYIAFSTGNGFYGQSSTASSTFAEIEPTDEALIITWEESVPWSKLTYNVFKENEDGDFVFFANVEDTQVRDAALINGQEYCYYIEAIGTYNIPQIEDPLVNFSQIVCARPEDNIPPCPPSLQVENVCSEEEFQFEEDDLFNLLVYTRPNASCAETNDVEGYIIYFSPNTMDELLAIDTIWDEQQNEYEHIPDSGISGCYAVAAIDSSGNVSVFSNTVCVDNCPAYELPNTFTPNDDGANDLFVPITNRFVERIDLTIYNEWGNEIFTTTNPNILWNGTRENGEMVPEGTYYYVCTVFEQRVEGILEASDVLKGFIHILR